jgi:hypothetical protein
MLVNIVKFQIFIVLVAAKIDLDKMCHTRVPTRNFLNHTNRNFSPFILNGRPAEMYNYKFKLSLHVHGKFYCSASVISSRYSLTAGEFLKIFELKFKNYIFF